MGFALGQRSQASCKLRAYSQHKVLHLPAKARPAGSGEAEQNCSPACRRVLVAPCPPRAPTCLHRRWRRAWRRSCGPWRRRGTHTPCPLSAPTCSHRHRRHAWRWRSCVNGTRRRQGMRTCSVCGGRGLKDEMKEGYLPLKNSILLKLWGLSRFLPNNRVQVSFHRKLACSPGNEPSPAVWVIAQNLEEPEQNFLRSFRRLSRF